MHHNNHNPKMMWLMMAGCLLLPLALLLFGNRSIGGGNWGWFALVGAFILVHILMMFGHGHAKGKEEKTDQSATKPKDLDSHNH